MKEILAQSERFTGWPGSSMTEIISRGNLRSVIKGAIVFLEGDPGKDFFVLLDGKIRLSKSTDDGHKSMVKIILPLEAFAVTVLFEDAVYPVTATAIEDSHLFTISKRAFLRFLDKPDFRDQFISLLMRKLLYLTDRILYLTSFDVEERFFRFLSDSYGKHETYTIDMSKKEVAGAVGTVPETLSRLLGRLKSKKVLEWENRNLRLVEGFWKRFDKPR